MLALKSTKIKLTCILGIGGCDVEKLLLWPELVEGSGDGEGLG